ncbi:MAG: porin family protein [Beijerinckiaceae bacterium]|jgi:outer membrane immunogenic protein|nr:porin family protein [Beijerinckiaceae bacterium]
MNIQNRIPLSRKPATIAIVLAAGAMFLQTGVAGAADLPARSEAPAPAPIIAPPIFTWTGFYMGANAGVGFGRQRPGFTVAPAGTSFPNLARGNATGGIIGLQAGYNWQIGAMVLGLETDIQYNGMRKSFGPVALIGGGTASGSNRASWYGTLRPRIGYAFDRTLIFATGGLAYGTMRNRLTAVDGAGNTFTIPGGKTRVGWTLGAGVEHAFTDNITAKLQYDYVDLGRKGDTAAVFNAGLPTGSTAASRNRNAFHTIRLGLNYKF